MSDAEDRKAIAAAATTVEGVNVTPYYRQTTLPGEGWVRLDSIDFPDKFGGWITWQVCVVLPQDQATAEEWFDNNNQALKSALVPQLKISRIRPELLAIDGVGLVPALVIQGQREQE